MIPARMIETKGATPDTVTMDDFTGRLYHRIYRRNTGTRYLPVHDATERSIAGLDLVVLDEANEAYPVWYVGAEEDGTLHYSAEGHPKGTRAVWVR